MALTRLDRTPNLRGPSRSVFLTAGATWTNMPAALTEFNGGTTARQFLDLRPFRFARLSANVGSVAGNTAAELRVQYSLNGGSTWAYLDGSAGPAVVVDDDASWQVSNFVAIADAAKVESALVRLVGITGDGAIDPVFGAVTLELSA